MAMRVSADSGSPGCPRSAPSPGAGQRVSSCRCLDDRSTAARAGSRGRWRCAMAVHQLRPTTATRRAAAPRQVERPAAVRCTCDENVEKKITPSALWKTALEPGAHAALRRRRAGVLGRWSSPRAAASTPRAAVVAAKRLDVRAAPVDRRVVDLEVAGVHDDADRRRDRQARRRRRSSASRGSDRSRTGPSSQRSPGADRRADAVDWSSLVLAQARA